MRFMLPMYIAFAQKGSFIWRNDWHQNITFNKRKEKEDMVVDFVCALFTVRQSSDFVAKKIMLRIV